jgi:pimeloyl-ACP methyl ester carboxylesterase
MMPEMLLTPQGRRIAYVATKATSRGEAPTTVFLGGFRSDMTGTKAVFLEDWARARGSGFLRIDYSGHGASSGRFEDGSISDWTEDAAAVIAARVTGRVILVGSSMGGWIALRLAARLGARLAGLVGIAAAPDFTDDLAASLTAAERRALVRDGAFRRPSGFDPEGYVFTARLLANGAACRVLDRPLALPCPAQFLHGTADADVPVTTALRIVERVSAPDLRLTLVKDADHRFSSPACLALIAATIEALE